MQQKRFLPQLPPSPRILALIAAKNRFQKKAVPPAITIMLTVWSCRTFSKSSNTSTAFLCDHHGNTVCVKWSSVLLHFRFKSGPGIFRPVITSLQDTEAGRKILSIEMKLGLSAVAKEMRHATKN